MYAIKLATKPVEIEYVYNDIWEFKLTRILCIVDSVRNYKKEDANKQTGNINEQAGNANK